jgi:hypothetical protein
MALTGNKGEWSEVYAHLRLLADGVLYSGNNKLQKNVDLFFPILKILRLETGNSDDNVFTIDSVRKEIIVSGNHNDITVSQDEFDKMAVKLLNYLKENKSKRGREKLAFDDIESFMNNLDMHYLKAKSVDKKDIRMVIHDFRTDITPELGFSIKSKLGGSSTLFNANKDGTNFLFRITGGITDEQIAELNDCSDTKEKRHGGFFNKWFGMIDEWGYKVEYVKMMNKVFYKNLMYVDTNFHKVLAECLLAYYGHKGIDNRLRSVMDCVIEKNPCGIYDCMKAGWYEYVMKKFLIVYALGMTANKPWNFKYDANGGYIVVKEDGEVVCYHFYDRYQLEYYLYDNTAFDTPSTSRHDFYRVWRDSDNGDAYLKLNPQIRFIHER